MATQSSVSSLRRGLLTKGAMGSEDTQRLCVTSAKARKFSFADNALSF